MQDNFWKDLFGGRVFSLRGRVFDEDFMKDFKHTVDLFYQTPGGKKPPTQPSLTLTPATGQPSVSKRLWDWFDAPILRALKRGDYQVLRKSVEQIGEGYGRGGPMIQQYPFLLLHTRAWVVDVEIPPQEVYHTISEPETFPGGSLVFRFAKELREFGYYLCLRAAEKLSSGNEDDLVCRFIHLYGEFSHRFWVGLFCRDEIARRMHEYKIRSLFVEANYSKKSSLDVAKDLERAIETAVRPIGGMDGDKIKSTGDFLVANFGKIQKQATEIDEIKFLLGPAFTGMRAQSEFVSHRRKRQSKMDEETIGKAIPYSAIKKGEVKVELVTQDPAEIPTEVSDEKKAALDKLVGKNVRMTLEFWFTGKYKNRKELAEARGLDPSTITRHFQQTKRIGKGALLEALRSAEKCEAEAREALLKELEREALKTP